MSPARTGKHEAGELGTFQGRHPRGQHCVHGGESHTLKHNTRLYSLIATQIFIYEVFLLCVFLSVLHTTHFSDSISLLFFFFSPSLTPLHVISLPPSKQIILRTRNTIALHTPSPLSSYTSTTQHWFLSHQLISSFSSEQSVCNFRPHSLHLSGVYFLCSC